MNNVIMNGCDLHDKNMALKSAVGTEKPQTKWFGNTTEGRQRTIDYARELAKKHGAERIVFAYEASGQGYGLYDELTAAGIECYVLAPTKMEKSAQQRKQKTDEKDALRILEALRGHFLAGNDLPAMAWIPDHQTREDREVVRCRLDAQEKVTLVKTQVQSLLKRNRVSKPAEVGKSSWTVRHRRWLAEVVGEKESLPAGARVALESLLRQLAFLEGEVARLDGKLENLSKEPRYAWPVKAMRKRQKGVGTLTAMVYLTEMGDLSRFRNRRQVAAYLGVVPSSNDSGERERKGHITRQGSPRVRKVLCQAVWSAIRSAPQLRAAYQRIAAKNPKKKKIAVVAMMRRLGIRLWHIGLEAQLQAEVFKKTAA